MKITFGFIIVITIILGIFLICLKLKINKLEKDRDKWKKDCNFYKNELELIRHG